ncbi:PREDICTED: ubiquitin carboxyl-terminal hydrolase 23 isoform X2 [Nelumbo nucifera]|uniref:Ubiquitin carboxyl-terminal hydrolase n=1 Tax=Nelumbo nucifera TaxID=4432 RepID=A0A1U8ADL8_NELNU|nr:PREDICTED: ubiquitin carboxyl-terminal hydrolase 23 isoform X2 [Nelumbo nucifera]
MAESLIGSAAMKKPGDGFAVPVSSSSNGSLFQRRIEFHPAKKPFSGFSTGNGDFHLETLNPSSDSQRTAATANGGTSVSKGKKSESVDFFEHELDPELSFGITFKRIGAGLENLGNTCFLNSVLQCLTYTEPFAAYLQSGKHQTSCRTAGFCAMCAIQNHVRRALQSTGRILAPKDLVMNLRCISRNFRNARQEDAHEYMVNLLESMHKCCLPSGVPSESPSAYEKSLVHKIFGGSLRSQVKCMQCSYCSNKFDPFLDLSLEINKADSLRKALTHFTAVEQLDGGEKQYQCQRCKQKVRALKQLTVHKAPYVLTIHLKRFGSHVPGQKIDKRVEFGPSLDLKPFVSGSYEGDLKYTLYGVLVHAGWSTHSGHYYCFVRTSSGMWHSLDDNRVVQVSERTVLEQKAYMLFYVRDRKSVAPKKPVAVLPKENTVGNAMQNKECGISVHGPKEKAQNGLVESRLSFSDCSRAVSQGQALCPTKEPLVKETSVLKSNGFITKAAKGPSLSKVAPSKPSLKEPHLKDLAQGQLGAEVSPQSTPSLANGSRNASNLNDVRIASIGAKHNPVNMCDGSKKDLNHNAGIVNEGSKFDLSIPVATQPDCTVLQNSGCEKLIKSNLPHENGYVGAPQEVISNRIIDEQSKENFTPRLSKESNVKIDQNGCGDYTIGISCPKVGEGDRRSTENGSVEISRQVSMDGMSGHVEASDLRHNQKKLKSMKKLLKCRVAGMHLSSSIMFRKSLSLRKKKYKKSKHRKLELKGFTRKDLEENGMSRGFGPSTSEQTRMVALDATHSRKQRARSVMKEGNINMAAKGAKGSKRYSFNNTVDEDFVQRISNNSAVLATNELSEKSLHSNSVANHYDAREPDKLHDKKRGSSQNGLIGMLMRVARWDGVELPDQILESSIAQSTSIGYVADEWDEEYDRGKRKKVKHQNNCFGGPNLFQEIATMKAQMKKSKMDQTSSGNRPFRI